MNIDASVISNFFLKKAHKEKILISQMKLIKLVYIAHGWSLAVIQQDLLNGEKVEAWMHGPVIPSIYHEFKRFGRGPIDTYAQTLLEQEESGFETTPLFIDDLDLDEENKQQLETILSTVWNSYKNYSAIALSQKTHEDETPWKHACDNNLKDIENESIKKYYDDFLTKYKLDEV